jgi:anthranilate synthase/aminodeoxychorismate synthase-like glutamine amidotransferase
MSKSVLIDFKDSFTYNIYHYLVGIGEQVDIIEDDDVDLSALNQYDTIIFSPGPGLPKEKISLFRILEEYAERKKILGICLGMQGIVEYFDGTLYNLVSVHHGVETELEVSDHTSLFMGLPALFKVGLYHSWACDIRQSKDLVALASDNEHVLMAIQHTSLPIFGVQFHPESVMTEFGKEILSNFVNFKN